MRHIRAVTAGVLSAALGLTLIPFAGVSSSAADTESETFTTVGLDKFTVPDGVTELTVTAIGGGGGSAMMSSTGGSGCLVSKAVITVTPGQVIDIFVGGGGTAMRVGGGGGSSNVNAGDIGNQVIAGGGCGTTVGNTGGSGCANSTGAGGAGTGSSPRAGGSGSVGGSGSGTIGTSGGNGNGGSGGAGGNSDAEFPSTGGPGFGDGYGGSTNPAQEGPGGGFGGGGSTDTTSAAGAGGSFGPGDSVTYQPAGNGGVWNEGWVNGGNGSVTIEWEPQLPGPLAFSNTDFGNVDVTDTGQLGVLITNTGDSDLTPSQITAIGPGITIPTENPGTCQVETPVPAGQNCTVQVEWAPTTAGSLTGASLTIAYPDGETASNSVTFTGTSALEPGQTQTPRDKCVLSPNRNQTAATVPLTKANCVTNAGQPIGTRLRQPATRGDMATPKLKCQIDGTYTTPARLSENYGAGFVYCSRGRLVLRTKNATASAIITWKAPANETYVRYKKKLTLRLS